MSVIAAYPESSRYVNDPLLIALAQNAALRLECECALVSLIYDGTPCVTAEAGRSTFLCAPYESSASLYQTLQQGLLDRIQSLAFFQGRRLAEQSDNVKADQTRHIVHNLSLLASQKQYAASEANSTQVSYAAVPIKSVSGQVLGIFSVLDCKVRNDFLSHETHSVLNDIASATSRHLESQHVQLGKDDDRQAKLNLSKFLEHNRPRSVRSVDKPRHSTRYQQNITAINRKCSSPATLSSSIDASADVSSDGTTFSADSTPLTTPVEEISEFSFVDSRPSLPQGSVTDSSQVATFSHDQPSRRALSVATSLIRTAHDLEGLVLLDASFSSDLDPLESSQDIEKASSSVCEKLEVSFANEGPMSARTTSFMSLNNESLDYLISLFPQGCVLKIGDEGVLTLVITNTSRSGPALYEKLDKTAVMPSDLNQLLHQAKSLIFMPLWDSTRQAFSAGMLGWAMDPMRVFTEHDLLSLSIYGRILSAEITRLDAIGTEAVKSDFVSSLSHELRSPLHGCLAAVEMLRDTSLDKSQMDLLEMIETCSSTLLYTMNHLLDFSAINDLDRMPSRNRRSSEGETSSQLSRNVFGRTVEDYLCRLVQEVVDGVFFGHSREQAAHEAELNSAPQYHTMRFDSETSIAKSTDVAVFLEMERNAAWYSTLPAGAWKRLVMNLFGNALKFCHQGHIEVKLKMVPDPKNTERGMAHLIISDTGIGMSENFLKHSLYRPFVQADPLVSGNGLGLNIVKQIVNDLRGTIRVKSTLGAGTRFDVLIPLLELSTRPEGIIPDGRALLDPEALLQGRTLCLLLSPHISSESTDASLERTKVLHSYVKSIAEGWFHMKVMTVKMADEVDADIYLAEASDYSTYACSAIRGSNVIDRPHTILVGNQPQVRQVRRQCPQDFVELNYPLGPQTLFRALHAALNNEVERKVSESITKNSVQQIEDRMDLDAITHQLETVPGEPSIPQFLVNTTQAEHLLLVDDNAINLKLLSAFIKKLSFSAHTAVDGEDAFELYKAFSSTNPFTTILMDISMPKMNGFESSRAIREYEAENNLPPARIIALTALGSEASRQEAEASGIDEFQTKPVAMKTLKGLLQTTP